PVVTKAMRGGSSASGGPAASGVPGGASGVSGGASTVAPSRVGGASVLLASGSVATEPQATRGRAVSKARQRIGGSFHNAGGGAASEWREDQPDRGGIGVRATPSAGRSIFQSRCV